MLEPKMSGKRGGEFQLMELIWRSQYLSTHLKVKFNFKTLKRGKFGIELLQKLLILIITV